MNRKNELERHLLTRNYDDVERIEELLETRYSTSGDQKPSLVLLPTGAEDAKTKSLLHEEKPDVDEMLQQRRKNTRVEVKLYFKEAIANQKKLVKMIQQYNRKKAKRPSTGVFPINKLLAKYKIPTYEEFEPLYELWKGYMDDLVFPGITDPDQSLPSVQMILGKLASAEYSGAFVTVMRSRNKNVEGLRGIVVFDTQYSLVLCIPRDENGTPAQQVGGFRFISKSGTLFTFDLKVPNTTDKEDQYVSFTIIGSRVEFRPTDRATKKFKNHNVDNIF